MECLYIGCSEPAYLPLCLCLNHNPPNLGNPCKIENCNMIASDSMMCENHGGVPLFCNMPKCYNKIRKHKYYTKYCELHFKPSAKSFCHFNNCTKRQQHPTRYCKSHGGGIVCRYPGCKTSARTPISTSLLCTKHGGGYRCLKSYCNKLSLGKRCYNYCREHYDEFRSNLLCNDSGHGSPADVATPTANTTDTATTTKIPSEEVKLRPFFVFSQEHQEKTGISTKDMPTS